MGLAILRSETEWQGRNLADITPAEFSVLERVLPEEMTGADFLKRYRAISDTATTVSPGLRYPVRQATAHPVGEQARVDRFAELLPTLTAHPDAAHELGALMFSSHQSYSACGLGSDGTDRLVELVRAAGPQRGVFGAKVTGGGSGGTVAVLGTVETEHHVRDIAARYANETGRNARVFAESGPGVTLQIDDTK